MATTRISNTQGGNISLPKTITASSYPALGSDRYLVCNNVTGIVITLPDASIYAGLPITIRNSAIGIITSSDSNVIGLSSLTPTTAILPGTVGSACTLVSDGTNWWVMS